MHVKGTDFKIKIRRRKGHTLVLYHVLFPEINDDNVYSDCRIK